MAVYVAMLPTTPTDVDESVTCDATAKFAPGADVSLAIEVDLPAGADLDNALDSVRVIPTDE